MRRNTKSKRLQRRARLFILLILMLILGICAWFYVNSLAYKVCRVEAGVEVVPSDFLKKPDEDAYFTEKSEAFSVTQPGEYRIKVKSGWFTHSSVLYIEDTVAPTGQAEPVQLEMGETCTAEAFAVEVTDITTVTIAYEKEPDFAKAGSQEVAITLTDLGGNTTTLQTELFISPVVTELTLEAGSSAPTPSDFLIAGAEVAFITDIAACDMNAVADYPLQLQVDGSVYESVLHVTDTVAPEGEVQNISSFTLVPRSAEEFVTSINDVTNVTVAFEQEPDITYAGTQTVDIVFTDAGGNRIVKQAELTLEEDTVPPVLEGVKDIIIYVGDSISYRKKVTVTDNCEEGLTLDIDNSQVIPNAEGVYPVIYTATDLAGNQTVQSITVTIKGRSHTQEEIDALADKVLAKIIKPEMTQLEIVRAIYDYNMSHIGYINHSDKGDWIQAAYEGLAEGKGDCYVFACTAKQLLTRAGITNMDIEKIPARTMHYWNLVDIGDGWYHFDTTPRKDHPTIFMWTDEQMMEYSNKHNKSHNYDPSLYPEIN